MTDQESTTVDLIPFAKLAIGDQSTLTVNARDLYAYLGLTSDYSLWIRRAIKRSNLIENVDYRQIKSSSSPQGGRPSNIFLLTQHGYDTIAAFYRMVSKKAKCTYVYAIQQGETPYIKIGMATNCAKRIQQLQNGSPLPLKFLGIWKVGEDAYSIEQSLHVLFRTSCLLNEWFCLSQKQIAQLKRALNEYPQCPWPSRTTYRNAKGQLSFLPIRQGVG